MKILQYRKDNIVIQVQHRPWEIPNAILSSVKTDTDAVLEKYAVFVFNVATRELVFAKGSNDLTALLRRIVQEVKTRFGYDIPEYVAGKTRIKDGTCISV